MIKLTSSPVSHPERIIRSLVPAPKLRSLFLRLFILLFFLLIYSFSEGKDAAPIKNQPGKRPETQISSQAESALKIISNSKADFPQKNIKNTTRKNDSTVANHCRWGRFILTFAEKGLVSLKREADLYDTDYLLTGNFIGNVVVAYRLKNLVPDKENKRSQTIASSSSPSSENYLIRQLRDARLMRTEPEKIIYRIHPPHIPFLARTKITASVPSRDFSALIDEMPVVDSKSRSARFFSFNPKKGTTEWIQYEFPEPVSVSAVEVYWVDDSELNGPYQVPSAWRILYRDSSGNFAPVRNASGCGKALDRLNRVTFDPVRTEAIRLEAQLEPSHTAGLYEWQVETDAESRTRLEYQSQKEQAEKEINVQSIFQPDGNALSWSVSIQNLTDTELELLDLGLPLPFNTQYGWDKEVTYNLRVIRHFWVAGHGSFVFCQRTNAEPPYLLMIPVGEAYFEYFDDSGRGIFCPYIHSKSAVERAISQGGRWRFPSTSAVLKPRGQKGDRLSYKFKFLWAEQGYQSVRDFLYEEGKFEVRVVPGMVVPDNLEALLAVRTKNSSLRLEPEFPDQTLVEEVKTKNLSKSGRSEDGSEEEAASVSPIGLNDMKNCGEGLPYGSFSGPSPGKTLRNFTGSAESGDGINGKEIEGKTGDNEQNSQKSTGPTGMRGEKSKNYRVYRIKFRRLGENLVTIKTADGRSMPLEFFVTEDLETLFKKRARFLVRRQQHRDPSKWYYGVFSDWDMKNKVLRSADDRDGLQTWLVDACDDAGNARPAFVASKNVYFPDQEEVAAVDLYIKKYLWGGMQMTDEEPFPFAIYGIPNWKVNRESSDPGRNGRLHLWRIYDYPHIVLLYYRMYQVARLYPGIKTELTAEEYLRRAYRTAIAYFTVPLKVEGWSAYETPTMNEIVLNELIEALEREGWKKEAAEVRAHWEKKVLHFVNDEPYLFGSEFAFDSTGFEATGAMARYAMKKVCMRGEERKKESGEKGEEVWSRERVEKFLERQVRLNVAARGWLETAYYYLGSDYRAGGGLRYTLSYMSQMGGWSLLDYALWWAKEKASIFDYLRLGYASYLSSWALINSGRPETGYGYWYPGEENDGAAAGGFEPLAWTRSWNGKWIPRGAWNYSAEEDVGFCGAVRAAATIVTEDPGFGTVALGGEVVDKGDRVEVIPRDGLRVRFNYVGDEGCRLHVEFDRGRLAAEKPVVVVRDFSEIKLWVEPRRVEGLDADEGEGPLPGKEAGEVEVVSETGAMSLKLVKVGESGNSGNLSGRILKEKDGKFGRGNISNISRDMSANASQDEVVLVIWGLKGEYEAVDGSGKKLPVDVQEDGSLRVRCR